MAEKPGELTHQNGILSETDKDIVSTVASTSDDEFIEKYSDELTERERTEVEADEESDDTRQLKAQIEETRSQMGETIDAIQEKLSFSNISEQVSEQVNSALETAKDAAYDATIGKARSFMRTMGNELSKSEIGKTAKNNPFPLFLIGLGVGLLAYNGFSGGKRPKAYRYDAGRNREWDSSSENAYSNKPSMLKSAGETVSGAAGSAYDSVGNAASTAYGSISNAAGSAYQGVTSAASNAYGSVNSAAHQAYEKVGEYGSQAREQYDYYIEENPLAVGAVAFAIGAAVGFAVPSTRYEGELMGEARQVLLDKAQDSAGGLVEKVKQMASEAQKTISDEVNTAVGETRRTVADKSKTQGMTH